ncbi:MAG: hypothetical protein NTW86_14180, partial [Candidatus Sumerlaeota bacterium]|nr:hypothetical protein [Candidatus Sumerlaeota bacterium]
KPDLLVILDLPVEEALRRVHAGRNGETDHFEEADSLRRVKAIFDAINDPFVLRLDARRSEAAIAEVILKRIEALLAA